MVHVLVLSCDELGARVAARLVDLPGVSRVSLVTAPYRTARRPRTLGQKLRHVWRMQGLPGLVDVVAGKLRPRREEEEAPAAEPPAGVHHLHVADFHAPAALDAMRALAPDLGVVAGTYILKEPVFALPRLGSINLHSGKVPEYRGAAPAFWELYNGEREVGITIHRVVAALDAGHVLAQETFPLDPAPPGDPLAYVERYRREVLAPNGVRMLADVVARLANGTAEERPQPTTGARTWRTPDYKAIRELRRRVAARRRSLQEQSHAA
jgi:methionyl-tRNA formyltransferase